MGTRPPGTDEVPGRSGPLVSSYREVGTRGRGPACQSGPVPRPVGESVLRLLRDEGPQTRSQLAESLGTSRTTISTVVAGLERDRLVAEGPVAPSSGGRRSTTVRLGPAVRLAAVSVGESRIRVTVLDGLLTVARPVTVDLTDGSDLRAETLAALRAALESGPAGPGGVQEPVLALGLSLASDLPGVTDSFVADLVAGIGDLVGRRPVVVERAARALARGERHGGVARGQDDVVLVRVGATVTTAAYIDGHLGRGHDDLAGAVGHAKVDEFGPACLCGSSGCLDSFVSVRALRDQAVSAARSGRSTALAARLSESGTVGIPDLAAAVSDGDPVAVQMARDVGRRVGETVAGLVALANPSTVVVGGPVAALGPHLLNEVRGAVYRRAPARVVAGVTVVLGTPGDRAALLGAALAASDRAFELATATWPPSP